MTLRGPLHHHCPCRGPNTKKGRETHTKYPSSTGSSTSLGLTSHSYLVPGPSHSNRAVDLPHYESLAPRVRIRPVLKSELYPIPGACPSGRPSDQHGLTAEGVTLSVTHRRGREKGEGRRTQRFRGTASVARLRGGRRSVCPSCRSSRGSRLCRAQTGHSGRRPVQLGYPCPSRPRECRFGPLVLEGAEYSGPGFGHVRALVERLRDVV